MLGPAELAQVLGVSRQRVTQIAKRPDFPRPRFVLIMGSVWALEDVMAWAEQRGRDLNLDALAGVGAHGQSTPQGKTPP